MTVDIEERYIDRINGEYRQGNRGDEFLSLLEMLPADERESGASARQSTQALVGSFLCNKEIDSAYCGGFDGGTVVNYFGEWKDCDFINNLASWQQEAKDREDRGESDLIVDYLGQQILVFPGGARGGINFRYRIRWQGFTILLTTRKNTDLPAVQVDFSYEVFRDCTIFEAREIVERLLSSIGFRWEKVTFQRLDFNVTLNESFSQVMDSFNDGSFVSRLRTFATTSHNTSDGRVVHYIRGGTNNSDCQIVIYDKSYELRNHYDAVKTSDLAVIRKKSDDLTRVEFRLTSSFFRTIDCKSFEKLEELMPSIVQYLCLSWFRIIKGKKVRGRENKQELSDFWKKVCIAFFNTFVKDDDSKPLVRKKNRTFNNYRLLKQASGCLTTLLARSSNGLKDPKRLINMVFRMIERSKENLYREVDRKRRVYETAIFQRSDVFSIPGSSVLVGS